MMRPPVHERLRALLGPDAVTRDPAGLPRATPDSAEGIALTCRLAHDEGWRVRVEGHGSWIPGDAPADLVLCTRGLDRIPSVSPADLVATVEAGVPMDALARRLAEDGMWLALDAPGRPERTIGSVVATATAGPLRAGFGPVRDHVLGCAVVTGDGRIVKPGGRVVKNVAGYDLTKLQVGGFGAFGVLTEVHVRLRAVPRRDVTLLARGLRDALTLAGRDLLATGVNLAALELVSPTVAAEPDWVLAARALGTDAGVHADLDRIAAFTGLVWATVPPERSHAFWDLIARAGAGATATVRLGVLQDGLDEALDLVTHELDEGLVWAGALHGGIRWAGSAAVSQFRALRRLAATREIPLTLERAPWELRQAVGHFGAYREGVGQLVGKLRETFDPAHRLVVALEGVE
ncbi:MAG TPA: FAD-binding oxidoreductase [Gemmatimonadales bacterium]|nr:FAD-binding oxidoreductase [Gemmatimonadales bacterium]